MVISLQLLNLITLFGVTAALTLSPLLWFFTWGNQPANRCLSLILVITSVLAITGVFQSEYALTSLQAYSIFSLEFILWPLLYFYARLLSHDTFRWVNHFWHLLPMLAMNLLWQLQISDLSIGGLGNVTCHLVSEDCNSLTQGRFVHRLASGISLSAYAIAALLILRSHRKTIKDSYSSIEEVNLNWLKTLLGAMLVFGLWSILFEVSANLTGRRAFGPGNAVSLFPLLFTIIIGAFGIRQRKIHTESFSQAVLTPPSTPSSNGHKYQTSSLTKEGAEAIWSDLQQHMENDKPYLQNGLKISDLASQLRISTSHLSETINGYANQSFYEFINHQRIDEAARLMLDESFGHLSVMDIGYQSGFNSNSTFFTYFKKYHGQTPRQYRNRAE
jgi:AraC-like DNA-binding protein